MVTAKFLRVRLNAFVHCDILRYDAEMYWQIIRTIMLMDDVTLRR